MTECKRLQGLPRCPQRSWNDQQVALWVVYGPNSTRQPGDATCCGGRQGAVRPASDRGEQARMVGDPAKITAALPTIAA